MNDEFSEADPVLSTRDAEQTRRALAESEERYRRATSAGRVGVWDWDLATNRVTWCDTTHDLHGVVPGEFDGKLETFRELIHPDDRTRMSEAIETALANGVGFEETFRVCRRNDQVERWLWTRAETQLSEDGFPARMSGATADVTERVHTEAALRDSEHKLRLALDTVPLSIFYLAPTLRITGVVNPPKGMNADDFVGRTDQEVYGSEAAAPLVALKRRVLESRIPSREEIWLPIAGRRRCFVMSVEPNFSSTGELLGLIDAAYDITELKEAEASAQRSTAILDTINVTTPTMIYMKDLECRMIFANPATQRIIDEMSEADNVGEPGNRHIPADFRDAITTNDQLVFESGETVTVEEVIPGRNGPKVVISTKSPYRNERGEIIGLIGVSTDITDRKQAEIALQESESRFRILADAAPVMIWVCDENRQCTYFNSTWLKFTGRTLEEELGTGWAASMHPEDIAGCLEVFKESMDEGTPFALEYRLRRHDGEYRWLLDQGIPRRDSEGKVLGYTGSCTDITDSKVAMEAMQEADRRKDEFLALLAHELRNPLAPINTSTEYLRVRGGLDGEAMSVLNVIGNQVNHLTRLVDDLLDIARITQNRIELRTEVIDLRQVAEAAIETCRPVIDSSNHQLSVEMGSVPVLVEADFARLNQVLQNLLLNAAKYTPDGGKIELMVEKSGADAVVKVRDSGIGIRREHLGSIFDLFVQEDQETSRTQTGLGMGLTLVKRLLELHGGSVGVESSGLGQGSTFSVSIPSVRSQAIESKQEAAPLEELSDKKKILIVDDNRDAADVLGKMMEFLGNDVRVVYSGSEAIDAVATLRPDMILMDLGMPHMDGYETAARLIESGTVKDTKLVVLTGWGQDDAKARTKEVGFHHHLVKPVSLATLTNLLKD